MRRVALVASLSGCLGACGGAPAPAPPVFPPSCSELSRNTYANQGIGAVACDTAPVLQRELLSVGGGYLLDWNHQSNQLRLWSVGAGAGAAPLGDRPVRVGPEHALDSGNLLLPLGGLKVLRVEPRSADFRLAAIAAASGSGDPLGPSLDVAPGSSSDSFEWPDTEQAFSGYDLLALDDDYLIKWWEGTGDYVVLRFDRQAEITPTPLALTSYAGTNQALRRGARLLNLGGGRLLEWVPVTGDWHVWSYRFAAADPGGGDNAGAGEIFDPTPLAQGHWDDPGRGDDILFVDRPGGAGGQALLIWERATGRVRLREFDPGALDPMSGAPISDRVYPELQSFDWRAPTQSGIQNIVVIMQSGRSFDSRFGQYCQAPFGSNPTCTDGPSCCEAMPASIPGASACTPLGATTDAYVPDDSVECMLSKIDHARMDAFATAATPAGCGDPRDFACAGAGDAAGAVAVYHRYADAGTLADRFFQSTLDPEPLHNLAYISQAAYQPPVKPQQLVNLAADARVRWTLYLDDARNVFPRYGYLPPEFFDSRWTFFRAPGEFERDVALEQLPDIAIVVAQDVESELPGRGSTAGGVAFVQSIADAVLASPRYAPTTLVVITYLSSGGFYDHLSPPPAPPPFVDIQMNGAGPVGTNLVPYGPRLPLLALGRFARKGFVSHAPLELSSLTVFLEWNWLGNTAVGALGGRDQIAANIGSLLDPDAIAGAAVPERALLAYPPGLVWQNGFEGADANAWASQKMGGSRVESDGQAHTGLSNGELVGADKASSFQATVPVVDGYDCTAEAWVRASANVAGASMQILDGPAAPTVAIAADGASDPPAYKRYTISFSAQGATATVVFRLLGAAQGELIDVDDAQVVCLPPITQD
jgi:hypothetical protein